jgi:phospholipid transport system substrate-binding protein
MSKHAPFLKLALLAAACVAPQLAAAEADDPVAMLRAGVDEVLAVSSKVGADLPPLRIRERPVLEKYFTFEGITRRAIGQGWGQFTPEQQQRVVVLFTELVIRTYVDKLVPGEQPKIGFGAPIELLRNRREVPSTLTYEGSTYAVTYRLEKISGSWRIYDVIIEGISMVSNYRTQFDEIFQKGGASEIIRSLEKKLAQLEAPKS